MGRKKMYLKVKIEDVVNEIALRELMGHRQQALGLRTFFSSVSEDVIDESDIEKRKKTLIKNSPELAKNYTLKTDLPLTDTNQQKPQKQRKTGVFIEYKNVWNRPRGQGGKKYRWKYEVTYEDGKRISSKSLGRVSE